MASPKVSVFVKNMMPQLTDTPMYISIPTWMSLRMSKRSANPPLTPASSRKGIQCDMTANPPSAGEWNSIEHHLVGDDVLDIVRHHRGRRPDDVDPKVALGECGERAMLGCRDRAGTGIWVQLTRGALSGVNRIIVTESSAGPAQVIKSAPAPGDSGKSRKEAMRAFWLLLGIAALAPAWTWADEGMWTFDNFPSEAVKQAYGVEITPAWLDHVRLSTIRLTNCTASFVSPQGLILTNHHCVESCLGELSSKEDSLLENGFLAPTPSAERRCATQVADVLVSMENVTAAVTKAVAGFSDEAANDARKRTLTALEQACEQASARSSFGQARMPGRHLVRGGPVFPL